MLACHDGQRPPDNSTGVLFISFLPWATHRYCEDLYCMMRTDVEELCRRTKGKQTIKTKTRKMPKKRNLNLCSNGAATLQDMLIMSWWFLRINTVNDFWYACPGQKNRHADYRCYRHVGCDASNALGTASMGNLLPKIQPQTGS